MSTKWRVYHLQNLLSHIGSILVICHLLAVPVPRDVIFVAYDTLHLRSDSFPNSEFQILRRRLWPVNILRFPRGL